MKNTFLTWILMSLSFSIAKAENTSEAIILESENTASVFFTLIARQEAVKLQDLQFGLRITEFQYQQCLQRCEDRLLTCEDTAQNPANCQHAYNRCIEMCSIRF